MPPPAYTVPWRTMLNAVGFSPLVVNTKPPAERCVEPLAESAAPPVADELLQPRVGPPGGFEQGQASTPTPGPQRLEDAAPSRSRTRMSSAEFVSPGTRLLAMPQNATQRPSAEITASSLTLFP